MRALVFTLLAAWSPVSAAATPTEKPPLPYYDWKACPFECCTYRRWKAEKSVVAYKTRNQKVEVAFRVEKGEWVRGIDGVVITHRYGVTKVLKQMELGYTKRGDKPVLSLQPGELVYTLHYLGEGSELFWYKGKCTQTKFRLENRTPIRRPRNSMSKCYLFRNTRGGRR